MMMKRLLSITISIASLVILAGCTTPQDRPQITDQTAPMTTTKTLTSKQISQLSYLIEEEKLAHDIYTTLGEQRDNKQFTNIPQSEAQHRFLMAQILENYNIPNPTNDKTGVFTNPELTALYNTLLTQGKQNAQEAIKVGIAIEQKDIADIEKMMPWFVDYPDIQSVLEKLLQWSRNHLKAFQRAL